jgi:hypothetical protein
MPNNATDTDIQKSISFDFPFIFIMLSHVTLRIITRGKGSSLLLIGVVRFRKGEYYCQEKAINPQRAKPEPCGAEDRR